MADGVYPANLWIAQLPDSGSTPGVGDEVGGSQGDTTSTILPPPDGATAPFDSTAVPAPVPALELPKSGAGPADTTQQSGPLLTMPSATGTGTGATATAQETPAARRGILGAHPAAIVLGLIAVHVLLVKLIAR